MAVKKMIILGSTGSIGRQALQVAEAFPDRIQIVGLTAGSNIDLLITQAKKTRPRFVVIADPAGYQRLQSETAPLGITALAGKEAVIQAAAEPADVVLSAISGIAGLEPTLAALAKGRTVALSNKESLVAGGHLVMGLAAQKGAAILPVDSEHSAIWQCLQGNRRLRRVILTASGGPFRNKTRQDLAAVQPEEALNHPNWAMGPKVTIDSATLMNKGLEVIEAKWLFGLELSQIEVVVHPQSIVHSLVEFVDGSVLAQMGVPDMRLPIQYALSYPDRWPASWPRLSLLETGNLTFLPPDRETFPALDLAYEAGRTGGTMAAVLNGANEAAVQQFLAKKIGFLQIPELISRALEAHVPVSDPSLEEVLEADRWSRHFVLDLANKDRGRGGSCR